MSQKGEAKFQAFDRLDVADKADGPSSNLRVTANGDDGRTRSSPVCVVSYHEKMKYADRMPPSSSNDPEAFPIDFFIIASFSYYVPERGV